MFYGGYEIALPIVRSHEITLAEELGPGAIEELL